MEDSAHADQGVGDEADLFLRSPEHEDLEAFVFVHVHMQRRDDGLMVSMLDLGQPAG